MNENDQEINMDEDGSQPKKRELCDEDGLHLKKHKLFDEDRLQQKKNTVGNHRVHSRRRQCGKSQPTLNLPGESKAIWCKQCPGKPFNVVNVVSKRCECGKSQPTLNLPGESKAIWSKQCP